MPKGTVISSPNWVAIGTTVSMDMQDEEMHFNLTEASPLPLRHTTRYTTTNNRTRILFESILGNATKVHENLRAQL